MEGIGGFVHSSIQQFGDAKLLNLLSYFIGSTTQDVKCLKEEDIFSHSSVYGQTYNNLMMVSA